jgi:cytochrome P450
MSTGKSADWNPQDKSVLAHPREAYDEMRERCPVAWSDDRGWSVFRYDDIVRISGDVETFSSGETWSAVPAEILAIPLRLDPPEHGQYRRLLQALFRPAAINAFDGRVRGRAVALLAPAIAAGEAEMVSAVPDPLPVQSICDFIGWPADDWREIKDRSLRLNRARHTRDAAMHDQVADEWRVYIRRHMEARRADPGDDVSSLFVGYVDQGVLTEVEAVSMLRLLLQAGHGTTTASAGICTLYLATHPQDQARLRADPAQIPRAIEEMLRVDNPLVSMPRRATKDTVVQGREISAGDEINLFYIAANRDEAQFSNASVCDFDRGPTRTLLFGTGIHTCIGAPFARLELKIYLEELLGRTRSFHLTPGKSPVRETYPRNEPRSLNITFEAA